MKIIVPCSYYIFGWDRGGIYTVADQFKKIFSDSCDLVKFGNLKNEPTINDLQYVAASDLSSYDCTFVPDIRGFSSLGENLSELKNYPRPIIARVDDIGDYKWGEDVDILWCFKNKMYEYFRRHTNKKVVISGLPYFPFTPPFVEEIHRRTIASICRLDPVKRIDTLIDVSKRVNGKIILLLFLNEALKFYNTNVERIAKSELNIECHVKDVPFEKKEIFRVLSKATSYYGGTVTYSGIGVEYAALEAMNNLCVPVVRSNMKSDYIREKYRAFFWEYHEDLIKSIEDSFVDQSMLYYNLERLQENHAHFKNMFMEVVNQWHLS